MVAVRPTEKLSLAHDRAYLFTPHIGILFEFGSAHARHMAVVVAVRAEGPALFLHSSHYLFCGGYYRISVKPQRRLSLGERLGLRSVTEYTVKAGKENGPARAMEGEIRMLAHKCVYDREMLVVVRYDLGAVLHFGVGADISVLVNDQLVHHAVALLARIVGNIVKGQNKRLFALREHHGPDRLAGFRIVEHIGVYQNIPLLIQ